MRKSEKEKKGGTGDTAGNGDKSGTDEKQFKITTIVAILAIIGAILAAGFGAYWGVTFQNDARKQTTAKLVYDDIDRMNWSLNHLSKMITEHPNALPYIYTPVYEDNEIYYSSRFDIASLDDNVARNISIFYTDMRYAETYRKAINAAVEGNSTINASIQINQSYFQFSNAILDANELRPQILDDLERIYNIPKSPPNRFNRY